MKRYTLTVVLEEGSDEFWDDINKAGKTGCDEVKDLVSAALSDHGFWTDSDFPNCSITLSKFEDINES